ncbi:hypothetical protein JFL75_02410 [Breznakiella homolactica]|uniref:Uncharacterized protein n=1 Tax=Breznakiella homolactica TaxID=2798577 RepID=A0A7T8BCN7_9SPIR|nr:hypothetical protein JFL75_02410 [Breznakiella homolactica]
MSVSGQEVLRGQVTVEMAPVYPFYMDVYYPLDTAATHRRALSEAAMFYSAMIYGWSFEYEIGERARGIPELFELHPEGAVRFGDPKLRATDAEVKGSKFYLWTDYRMDDAQLRRIQSWRAGTVKNAQAVGYGPIGMPVDEDDWIEIKKKVLEDAGRAAVRALLQGTERNRPKAAKGFIALAAFPSYWIDAGQWAASARFRVEITEIIPFSAY